MQELAELYVVCVMSCRMLKVLYIYICKFHATNVHITESIISFLFACFFRKYVLKHAALEIGPL